MAQVSSMANCREDHLLGARELLEAWRYETWMKLYRRRPWGMQCLLPDTILTAFATKARLQTPDDLIKSGWSRTHVQRHGAEIIDILRDYDSLFKAIRDDEIEAHSVKKKKDTAAKQQAKRDAQKEERARQRAIRAAQPKPPKPPRPSRAKKQPMALASSTIPNTSFQPCVYPTTVAVPLNITQSTIPDRENIPLQTATPFTRAPIPPAHFYQPLTPMATHTSRYSRQEPFYSSNISYHYQPPNLNTPQGPNHIPFTSPQSFSTTPLNLQRSFNPLAYSFSIPLSSTSQSPNNVERRI